MANNTGSSIRASIYFRFRSVVGLHPLSTIALPFLVRFSSNMVRRFICKGKKQVLSMTQMEVIYAHAGNLSIFKMAAVRHFEFCTKWILNIPQSVNIRWRYSNLSVFKMAAVRHLEFHTKWILNIPRPLEMYFLLTYQIWCKYIYPRSSTVRVGWNLARRRRTHADDEGNVKMETRNRISIWRPFVFRNRK